MKKDHVIVVIGCLVVAGAAWVFIFYVPGRTVEEADVTVEGIVVSTQVETDWTDETTYRPNVDYRYQYDGQTYRDDNFEAGGTTESYGSKSTARSFLSGYEQGDSVTVYLNSNEPSESFLRKPRHGVLDYGLVSFPVLVALLFAYGALTKGD